MVESVALQWQMGIVGVQLSEDACLELSEGRVEPSGRQPTDTCVNSTAECREHEGSGSDPCPFDVDDHVGGRQVPRTIGGHSSLAR